MNWLFNEDFDRWDLAITLALGLVMMGIFALGGPLWVVVPTVVVTFAISLYRHRHQLLLPPRK